jgi:hypothetical protein
LTKVNCISLPFGNLFFDGEATNSDRINAWAQTLYTKKYLILINVEFY